MTIETVDPALEAEALGQILHACVHEGASVNFVLPFGLDEATAYWQNRQGWIVLIAREGGRILGTVSLAPAPQPNQRYRAEVGKMLVHPEARRRGIARRLMTEVETVAQNMGRTLLTLDTEAGSGAEDLYLSLGYQSYGVVPEFALNAAGDQRIAARFFYKHLTPQTTTKG